MLNLIRWFSLALVLVVGCQGSEPSLVHSVKNAALTSYGVKLIPTTPSTTDWFGRSVALSKGSVVVGAPGIDRAYIFTGSGSTWKQQDYVLPSDVAGAQEFGKTTAIDGDTAVIGYNGNIAYLFQRSGTTWLQKKRLFDKGGPYSDACGRAVDVDGDTIIVGATHADSLVEGTGAAYIFVRSGTNWKQQATLRDPNSVYHSRFGNDVAVDGNTAIISTIYLNKINNSFVYIYVRTGTSWSQEKVFSDKSHEGYGSFGVSVDVSNDTVAIGEPINGRYGSIYVYTRSGTSWSLQQKLTSTGTAKTDYLGQTVSLDKNVLATTFQTSKAFISGIVFHRRGTTWTETQKLDTEERGHYLSISVDGDTVALGNSGSAYVYAVVKPDYGPDLGHDAGPPDLSTTDNAAAGDPRTAQPAEGCSCITGGTTRDSPRMMWFGLTGLLLLIQRGNRRRKKPRR